MNAAPLRAETSPPQPFPQGGEGVREPAAPNSALTSSICGGGREGDAPRIGIAGAGLAGRLLAWRLLRAGYAVELFDAHARADRSSAGPTAAAMLSPTAELAAADAGIHALGVASLSIWPQWLAELHAQTGHDIYFRR